MKNLLFGKLIGANYNMSIIIKGVFVCSGKNVIEIFGFQD